MRTQNGRVLHIAIIQYLLVQTKRKKFHKYDVHITVHITDCTSSYGLCHVVATAVNHCFLKNNIYILCNLTVQSLFLPCPPLQHLQHPKKSIDHAIMFKGHLIEGVQR